MGQFRLDHLRVQSVLSYKPPDGIALSHALPPQLPTIMESGSYSAKSPQPRKKPLSDWASLGLLLQI
jgi:hypothetical protein